MAGGPVVFADLGKRRLLFRTQTLGVVAARVEAECIGGGIEYDIKQAGVVLLDGLRKPVESRLVSISMPIFELPIADC